MFIPNLTPAQEAVCKQIIKELLRRPQMPCKILAIIIKQPEDIVQKLLDHLEYQGSISKRVTVDFLQEAEANVIQKIHEELTLRLAEDKIKSLPIYDLEKLLESSLERKKILDWGHEDTGKKTDTSYIDKLISGSKKPKK